MNTLKKVIVLLLFFIALSSCNSKQKSYTITGTIPESENGKYVYIHDYSLDLQKIDSALIKNGSFELTGMIERPESVMVYAGKFNTNLILENDVYRIEFVNPLWIAYGGKINDIVFGFKKDPKYIEASVRSWEIRKGYSTLDNMDKAAVDSLNKRSTEQSKVIFNIMNTYKRSVLDGDYDALTKLFVCNYYSDAEYNFDKKLALLDAYEEEFGQTQFTIHSKKSWVRMKKDAESRETVTIGKSFKNIIAVDVNGVTIDLSEVVKKNKYTLLEMWASWCGPCRAQFPHLKKAYKKYHDKGFEIYAISMDNKKERWVKAMDEENVPWIDVVDYYKAFKGAASLSYGVKAIPAAFLINSEGIIVATGKDAKGFALDKKLEELLKD